MGSHLGSLGYLYRPFQAIDVSVVAMQINTAIVTDTGGNNDWTVCLNANHAAL